MDKNNKLEKMLKWRNSIIKAKVDIIDSIGKELSNKQIAEYFLYNNMKKNHKDFCFLYSKDKICHNTKKENFCCYGCDCPNYDIEYSKYEDNDKRIVIGRCKINSKNGKYIKTSDNKDNSVDYYIWDCSECIIPHNIEYIKGYIKK